MIVALLASSIGLAGCHHCGKHRCKTHRQKACWTSPYCGPKVCSPVCCKPTCCCTYCRGKCYRSLTYRYSYHEDPEVRDFLQATLKRDHCWGDENRKMRYCREQEDRGWGKDVSIPRCVPRDYKAGEWMERLYGPAPCW
jgi:hypothetical protein